MLVVGKNLDMLTTDPLKWIYFLIDVTALPLAVGRLHELHELLILDVFFRLLGLSERAYKGHTAFIFSSSSCSFLVLDFLVDSYIVV